MKHLKRINEEFGIYSRLWTIKESDFKDFFNDLNDIGQVDIEYLYADPNGGFYSNKSWKSVDLVDRPPNNENGVEYIPAIVCRTIFYDLRDIEKCSEYYQLLLEAKDRLVDQFGEKNIKTFLRDVKMATELNQNKKICIGYNFYIFNG